MHKYAPVAYCLCGTIISCLHGKEIDKLGLLGEALP